MSIKKVDRPTLRKKVRDRHNINDVKMFLDSGWDCAEVGLDGRKFESTRSGLYYAVRKLGAENVRIVRDGERLYLVRTGEQHED